MASRKPPSGIYTVNALQSYGAFILRGESGIALYLPGAGACVKLAYEDWFTSTEKRTGAKYTYFRYQEMTSDDEPIGKFWLFQVATPGPESWAVYYYTDPNNPLPFGQALFRKLPADTDHLIAKLA